MQQIQTLHLFKIRFKWKFATQKSFERVIDRKDYKDNPLLIYLEKGNKLSCSLYAFKYNSNKDQQEYYNDPIIKM